MRILHLTDLHFQSSVKLQFDQNQLIEGLIANLQKEKPVDIFIFSGDLVQAGSIEGDFYTAKEILIDRIVNDLKIKKSQVFICGGNHDVNRGQELEPIADAIKQFKSNDDIENFIKQQDGKSYHLSLSNLKNYIDFEKLFYVDYADKSLTSEFSDLYNLHFFELEEKKIGVASMNSAWRALDSKTDSGNLLFPISMLKKAIDTLKSNSDFRIAILHHQFPILSIGMPLK